MQKYTYWFRELVNLNEHWANGLNQGKLYVAGFPIPAGFVVAPGAKQEIQKSVGIDDVSKISPSSIPEPIRKEIVNHYFKLNINYNYDVLNDSAKALVDFGRQANLVLVKNENKAYPNIRGTGEVLEAVLKCFSVGVGPIVVQKMVSPEKAGIVFSSKAGAVSVEATYGFANPIAKKAVEPDVYTVSKAGEITGKSRGAKRFALVTNPHSRIIEKVEVSREKQETYALHQREIEVVCRLAKKLEERMGKPQKATWGIEGRRVYLLDTEDYSDAGVPSYSSTPSYGSEIPSHERSALDKPSFESRPQGASIFDSPTETISPLGGLATPTRESSFLSDSKTASTQHDSSRSGFDDWGGFGGAQASKPSPQESKSSDMFGDFAGAMDLFDSPKTNAVQKPSEPAPSWQEPSVGPSTNSTGFGAPMSQPYTPPKEETPSWRQTPQQTPSFGDSTGVAPASDPFSSSSSTSYGTTTSAPKKGIVISSKEDAQSVASQPTDAVLIKIDDINQGGYATTDNMARTVYDITGSFSDKLAIVRLGDARASAGFTGARGVRRIGTQEFRTELEALSKIATQRPSLKLAIPFVTCVEEVRKAKDALTQHGLNSMGVGVVVETPAAVSIVDKLAELASFVLIDADSLAELLLVVDKSNSRTSHLYDAKHDSVLNAVKGVIKICKSKNTPVYVCGEVATHSDFSSADVVFSEAKDFKSETGFSSSALSW